MKNSIIGTWRIDPNDKKSYEIYGDVTITFYDNGELIYLIFGGDTEQKIIMKYVVEDDFLITDQPSAPKKIKTNYFINGDILELNFDGVKSRFIKVV